MFLFYRQLQKTDHSDVLVNSRALIFRALLDWCRSIIEHENSVDIPETFSMVDKKGLYYAMWRQQIGERKSFTVSKTTDQTSE